jgi:hypothetical protein
MCKNAVGQTALATITVLLLLNAIQPASAATPTNACALLTQAQIATVLGVEVDAGKNIIGPDDCRFIQKGAKPGSDAAELQVNLTKAQAFEIGKTPLPNWTKTPITGLGDEAYSADRGGKIIFPAAPSLSIKKGSVFVVIIAKVPKADIEQTKAVEKKIASAILEKL